MSFLLRQICLAIVLLVAVGCAQALSIGYRQDNEDSLHDRPWYDDLGEKRSQIDYYSGFVPLHKRGRHQMAQRNFAAPRGKRLEETPQTEIGGRAFHFGAKLVPDDVVSQLDDAGKRAPYLKLGKRDGQITNRVRRSAAGDKTFLRIGRLPSDSTFLRLRRAPFLRIGRASFLRFGRSPFLRIGRTSPLMEQSERAIDQRAANDQTFLRFGRASGQSFLRIGRNNGMLNDEDLQAVTANLGAALSGEEIESSGPVGKRGLRIGKRILDAFNQGNGNSLTPDELQLLKENKELLLQYMENHPEMFNGDQSENDDAYFAFPRQGRAMSFYFPRMGRSGEGELSAPYCCEEGVRKIYTPGKGAQEFCSDDKPCCPGSVEQEKTYRAFIITECSAKSGSDKFRSFIGDE